MNMTLDKKEFYNDLKREVTMTLSDCLFGRKTENLSKTQKVQLNTIMGKLDETFKQHGVDWKLTE